MKKTVITLISIILVSLSTTACNFDFEYPTQEERDAEFFMVDQVFIENIYTALESIGMPKESVRLDKIELSEDRTIYNIAFRYEIYRFTAISDTDYNITDITCGTVVYMQDSVVISDISSLSTNDQRAVLQIQTEMDVKNNLISPATAKFPKHILQDSEWDISRDGNIFTVTSWVDAQNENGALLRYNFTVTYDWDGTDDTDPVLIDVVISQ